MGRFEDERGTIEDILGPVDCVTEIFTHKGAVRGNHVHRETTQWTMVTYGELAVSHGPGSYQLLHPTDLLETPPGTAHAWKALEDTLCLVFTRGPRGEDYESDTYRLDVPLL